MGRADAAEEFPRDRDGLEAAARKARYRFLEQAAGRCGARWVAVAHTADDQAETILHRIVRGTGLAGLSGMARARPLGPAALIRPMLSVRRSEVLEYLSDIGQPFRTDPTNADLRFTRNRLRHELLPHLAQAYNPNVVDALLRLGRLAGEVRRWMDRQIEPLQSACRLETDGTDRCIRINTRPLHAEPAAAVRELLVGLWRQQGWPMQQMGFEQWDLLADMALASGEPSRPPRKHTFPGGIQAEAGPDELVLHRPSELPG
ncbi:MAG: tRNA lysidine(34) synthetase TilS [Thermoguttaceae bacterium]